MPAIVILTKAQKGEDMAVAGVGEFLFDDDLGRRMREVAAGREVLCTVAFWTPKGVAELFPTGVPRDARIICDISMGSTSPAALEDLGAPRSDRLKHALSMHAKVILSDRGLVVGSANATRAAIGHNGVAQRNVEAGTFHEAGSEPWQKAAMWFEGIFKDAQHVRQSELDWANSVFRSQPPPMPRPPAAGSLLELVRAAPDRFASVGFVFASTSTKLKARKRITNAARALDPTLRDRLGNQVEGGIFGGWGRHRAERWPGYFFEFWQPNRRLSVYARRLEARVPDEGGVIGVKDWPGVRAQVDIALPSAMRTSKADEALALRLRGKKARFFASGPELAKWMAEREWIAQGQVPTNGLRSALPKTGS